MPGTLPAKTVTALDAGELTDFPRSLLQEAVCLPECYSEGSPLPAETAWGPCTHTAISLSGRRDSLPTTAPPSSHRTYPALPTKTGTGPVCISRWI